jgi:hypothetical protein
MPTMKGRLTLPSSGRTGVRTARLEAPIVASLQQQFKDQDCSWSDRHAVTVMSPAGATATPAEELVYTESVRRQHYGTIDMAVPVSGRRRVGHGLHRRSLVDRDGKVAMYHPGSMTREEPSHGFRRCSIEGQR